MSRLSWRDEERLRSKIDRLEEQLDEVTAALEAERTDHKDTHKALAAALAEIERLRP